VDLVPHKVCSYDCIYCQLGRTTEKTIDRYPYVSTEVVARQVRQQIDAGVRADYVTLGGSGEPTLNSNIGETIAALKADTDLPVAVLTNSSILWNPEVRDALCQADVVLPSLDAYDGRTFERINRPHPDIAFGHMLEGLIHFRQAFQGKIWLEIFALAGLNADPVGAESFRELVSRIEPDRVHVNTAVRPTSESYARRVEDEDLLHFCRVLGEKAEVVVPFQGARSPGKRSGTEKDLLNVLARRPCTLHDLTASLNVSEDTLLKYIEPLIDDQTIETAVDGTTVYYRMSKPNELSYEKKEGGYQS
jgi:wyosine [tRNA(Phe)-imidazoG37] synthetase (radical SAM superfamily)